MKTALVTTTIHVPTALEGYCRNFAAHGHADVACIVIGDLKTPPEAAQFCGELSRRAGVAIEYWDPARQRAWLKDQPELDALIPWNSVQRRNLGYLLAAAAGAECIVTIDDDNHATDDDFAGGHAIVGRTERVRAVSSSTRWFNTASLLVTEPPKPLFHRGFPTCMRGLGEELSYREVRGRVVMNAGLWLDVPDADAMSHLDAPVRVVGYRQGFDGRIAIAPGTNMVFNSQNTAFHRDTLPAMFLPPMGGRVGHLEVGRYDDIWMGIFFKRIADRLGDLACVGRPLVRQLRNDHDLLKDLLLEVPAMRITNKLTKSIERVQLTASDWGGCYLELIAQLRDALPHDGYGEEERGYLREMYWRMEVWAKIAAGFRGASAPRPALAEKRA